MKSGDQLVLAWLVLVNGWALAAFGFDKWRATRSGRRVPEWQLLALGAAGGWLGGWLGMRWFRHKTVKTSFRWKYGVALLACIAWLALFVWMR